VVLNLLFFLKFGLNRKADRSAHIAPTNASAAGAVPIANDKSIAVLAFANLSTQDPREDP